MSTNCRSLVSKEGKSEVLDGNQFFPGSTFLPYTCGMRPVDDHVRCLWRMVFVVVWGMVTKFCSW